MKNFVTTIALFLLACSTIFSQQKLGSKLFAFGNYNQVLEGPVLLSYSQDAATEHKLIKAYSKRADLNVMSWSQLFIPGTDYSKDDILKTLKENNIKTVLIIKSDKSHVKAEGVSAEKLNFKQSLVEYAKFEPQGDPNFYSNVVRSIKVTYHIFSASNDFESVKCVVLGAINNTDGSAISQRKLTLWANGQFINTFDKYNIVK